MPKTESELWDWVVEYNRHTTHDRGLTAHYGYQSILDVNLIDVCQQLHAEQEKPIRILDVGCGNGLALKQLGDHLERRGFDRDDFEFWGNGLNRYDDMHISDDRLILDGIYVHNFEGQRFHLIFSVFAFQYLWHKLEGVEKIHNDLLEVGGHAYLHFPGYLVRRSEKPEAVAQNETDGNERFREFVDYKVARGRVCPMRYKMVPYYSDDDDCALLAEFGNLRFQKTSEDPISFDQTLQAFAMFDKGFSFSRMDASPRQYIASHYEHVEFYKRRFGHSLSRVQPEPTWHAESPQHSGTQNAAANNGSVKHQPHRIMSIPVEVESKSVSLDIAIHEEETDTIVVICPGTCETLAGRVIAYSALAEVIVQNGLGAVVRYNDPFEHDCNYAQFLYEKFQRIVEFTLSTAAHFCSTDRPKLKVMAYSSSAGAAAALAAKYSEIESLLLISPSYDIPKCCSGPGYRQFRGDVRVLIGEEDEVVLPQQAFWYYQHADQAASREYVEVPGCGHNFEGPGNKSILMQSPLWAFGEERPTGFPYALTSPTEAWQRA